MKPFVIAIDGPAASGKGTLARRLADALGLPYLDTGLLYRATASLVLASGAGPERAETFASRLSLADLDRADLRTPEVDRMASRVSAIREVRAALLETQRAFARSRGGVLDGRDIGTVVFPGADLKLFVTASTRVRAGRRLRQRAPDAVPGEAEIERERQSIETRDHADETRIEAPLTRAADAILLETSDLDADQAFELALGHAKAVLARRGS